MLGNQIGDPPPALLLAAGRGNRLLPLTHDRPKCLVEVGGAPILLHQLRALKAAGVRRVEIITGHGAALVEQTCADAPKFAEGLAFAHNADYLTTSSLYSLGCTTLDAAGATGLMILNTDVLFHPDLAKRLLADPRGNVLLAEFDGKLGEEEMKICVDSDNRVTAVSKAIEPALAQAENLGVLKVGAIAAEQMLRLARNREFDQAEGLNWVPDSIHALRDELDFFAFTTGGLPWIEIDYHHDLAKARTAIWPKIATAMAAATLG